MKLWVFFKVLEGKWVILGQKLSILGSYSVHISDFCRNVVEKKGYFWQNFELLPDFSMKVCILEEIVGEIGDFL